MIHFISGPVVLSGTSPFTIKGIGKAFVDFKIHANHSKM